MTEVSLPKEAHLLDRLTRLEELSHFVSKSCKDEGALFPSPLRTSEEVHCCVFVGALRTVLVFQT